MRCPAMTRSLLVLLLALVAAPVLAQGESSGGWFIYGIPGLLGWFLIEVAVEYPILALIVRCCGWERLLGAAVVAQIVSTVASALLVPLWFTVHQMSHGGVRGIVAFELWGWTFLITALCEWIVLLLMLRESKPARSLLAAVCMNLASAGVLALLLTLVPKS